MTKIAAAVVILLSCLSYADARPRALIVLHTVDGREVSIAPAMVTSLMAARDDKPNELFTESARCLVNLVDGKFITVAEKCSAVRQLIEESTK
ncbi:hypothetical protein ABIF78_007740 [Bradyrhizobium japonicum]